MVNTDPKPIWFSGLGLDGECARQYELDQSSDGVLGSAAGQSPGVQASDETSVLRLEGLAPITMFVGANNSGKSRLMRELFLQEQFDSIKLSATDTAGLTTAIDLESDISEITIDDRSSSLFDNGWLTYSNFETVDQCLNKIETRMNGASTLRRKDLNSIRDRLAEYGFDRGLKAAIKKHHWYIPILRGMRPLLTLEHVAAGGDQGGVRNNQKNDDPYLNRTIHDYFKHHRVSRNSLDDEHFYRVFSGLSLFADLRKRLLGRTQSERDSVRHYEGFLSDNFFGGMKVILVPVEEDGNDVVHIKIGNNEEYPIYQLGDGLQSLIICTYPIVTEQRPGSLFFIEEPDLGMHPSLQRSFVDVLKSYHLKKGHQFFLTTHSNHLLDLLEDDALVSIFSFSEKQIGSPEGLRDPDTPSTSPAKFRIRRALSRDRQVLMQLGVRPSATYLANATIWVEGPSDCTYLRAYMEAFIDYLKTRGNDIGKVLAQRLSAYKEDRHYAFVEYSGANLVHFDFAENTNPLGIANETNSGKVTTHAPSLCAQSIVIADKDNENKADRIPVLSKALGERFVLLPGKEIVNLIPEEMARQQVLADLTSRSFDQAIADNVSRSIQYAGYSRTPKENRKPLGIGKYLDDIIDGYTKRNGQIFKYTDNGGSGTLRSSEKKKWARKISELIRKQIEGCNSSQSLSPLDLPPWLNQDIVWLMVLIYEHISLANHDTDALKSLRNWKQWIRQKADHQVDGDQWPIPDPADDHDGARKCLLAAFLSSQG